MKKGVCKFFNKFFKPRIDAVDRGLERGPEVSLKVLPSSEATRSPRRPSSVASTSPRFWGVAHLHDGRPGWFWALMLGHPPLNPLRFVAWQGSSRGDSSPFFFLCLPQPFPRTQSSHHSRFAGRSTLRRLDISGDEERGKQDAEALPQRSQKRRAGPRQAIASASTTT